MKKAAGILICCVVLQIAQSALLTLAVMSLAGLYITMRLLFEAGERGAL